MPKKTAASLKKRLMSAREKRFIKRETAARKRAEAVTRQLEDASSHRDRIFKKETLSDRLKRLGRSSARSVKGGRRVARPFKKSR